MICAEHLDGMTCNQGRTGCVRPTLCHGAEEAQHTDDEPMVRAEWPVKALECAIGICAILIAALVVGLPLYFGTVQ